MIDERKNMLRVQKLRFLPAQFRMNPEFCSLVRQTFNNYFSSRMLNYFFHQIKTDF